MAFGKLVNDKIVIVTPYINIKKNKKYKNSIIIIN